MTKKRVTETNEGIQGEFNVEIFDSFQRRMRDRGWMETDRLIKEGLTCGHALEIGPGPGYLGLEWLKKTEHTRLTGVDISPDMVKVAEKNAREYGFLNSRAAYVLSNAGILPFEENSFDSVFSNGSLHEWENPSAVLNELTRVLKPGGKAFISDLRRDINILVKCFLRLTTKPREIRPGLETSINAAYTENELKGILAHTRFGSYSVARNPFGIEIIGEKARPQVR